MNIVVLGAGAIGSLFGALLSKKNTVVLVGRAAHADAIQKNGLTITGKTTLKVNIQAKDSIKNIDSPPDLLLVTVKSYDTKNAVEEAKSLISDKTTILSLQNGLDNIQKIKSVVPDANVLAGVTTHGAILAKPGLIQHTGIGATSIGELSGKKTERLERIVSSFCEAGVDTNVSTNITTDIWKKAIVNASINPLTAFFNCKNGYLLENPCLEPIVEKVCSEATAVSQTEGLNISYEEMIESTKEVIRITSDNYSSMLQSVQRGKKTEIDSINGIIVKQGKHNGKDVPLNELLVYLISSLS